jgi:hypothetical protein
MNKELHNLLEDSREKIKTFYYNQYHTTSNSFLRQVCDYDLINKKLKEHDWLLEGKIKNTIYIDRIRDIDDIVRDIYDNIRPFLTPIVYLKNMPLVTSSLYIQTRYNGTLSEAGGGNDTLYIETSSSLNYGFKFEIRFYVDSQNKLKAYLVSHKDLTDLVDRGIIKESDVDNEKKTKVLKFRYTITKLLPTILKNLYDIEIPKGLIDSMVSGIEKVELKEKVPVVVSIDPYDFITASENTTGWRSCFRFGGEYHLCTNSFARSEDLLITYILDDSGNKVARSFLGLKYLSKYTPEDILIFNGGSYYEGGECGYNKDLRKSLYNKLGISPKAFKVSVMNSSSSDFNYFDSYKVARVKDSTFFIEKEDLSGAMRIKYDMYSKVFTPINLEGDDIGELSAHRLSNMSCECCGGSYSEGELYYVLSHNRESERICEYCIENRDEYYFCEGEGAYFSREYSQPIEEAEGGGYLFSEEYLKNNENLYILGYDSYGNYSFGDIDDYLYIRDTEDFIRADEVYNCEINGWYIPEEDAIFIFDKEYYIDREYTEEVRDYIYLEDIMEYVSSDYEYVYLEDKYYYVSKDGGEYQCLDDGCYSLDYEVEED